MNNDNTTPSHSEETETTENSPFNLPLKLVGMQIRDAFGYNIISRFTRNTKKNHKQYIVTAVNSYAKLKATLVSERQMRSDMQMEFKTDRAKLQSDNEAKEKRIQGLTEIVEEMSKALKMVKRHGLIEKDGYESTLEQVNRGLVTEALYLTIPIDTKP